MTVTVKLDPLLEEQLRRHAALNGLSASDVIRSALQAYLAQPGEAAEPSAFELGRHLFGRHRGAADLARQRKSAFAEAADLRHARRGDGAHR